MRKKLVFDMDGTLLDSMGMWSNIYKDLIDKDHKFESTDPLAAEEGSMLHYVYNKVKENFPDVDQEKIYRVIHEHIVEFYSRNDLAKEFVKDKLQEFADRGYDMYVATATDHYFADIAIKSNDLDKFIKKIYTPDTLMHSKGDLEYFEAFIEDIGAERNDIVFFDDALYANHNANDVGIISVGVYDDNSYYSKDLKNVSQHFINDFSEIDDDILL